MDAASFKSTFFPMRRRLYRVAYCLTGDAADAEVAVQDVYLRLWERRALLGEVENCEAYAVRLVKNRCFDLLAARGRHAAVDSSAAAGTPSDEDIDRRVAARDRAGKVMEIIGSMPQQQARVVTMRDVEGATFDEIHDATGMSAVNIRVTLSRARNMIRKHFSND